MQGQRRRVAWLAKEVVKKWVNGYQGMEIMCSEPWYTDKNIAQDNRIEQGFLKEYCFIHEVQTGLFECLRLLFSCYLCCLYEYWTCFS